jgi:histidinol-phosphate aminotransferase
MTVRPKRALLNPDLRRPSALLSVPRNPARLWLDKNENLDRELMALAAKVLASIPHEVLATYPEAGELYRKLARMIGVSPESLLLTPGSDGAIRLTFEAFVEHGDAVVHTVPTFAMYPVYSLVFGAQVCEVHYTPGEEGPVLRPQAIIDAVRNCKPKLLCLPNPDSPTGTTLPSPVLREILSECESVGTVFLVDEAYHPFHESSVVSWTQESQHLIVARTFAKAWGAAGMRIGYAVAHPETNAILHKLRPMYETSTIAIEFMCRMLDHPAAMTRSVARILDGKAHFERRMRSMGFKVLPTSGNFVHIGFGRHGAAVHTALADEVLYRASFEHPCLAGYSRFSAAPEQTMEQVAILIERAMRRG